MLPLDKLRLTAQWVIDKIDGEIVERGGYRRTHLSFDSTVSQRELDALCLAINTYMAALHSPVRIVNQMGEIIYAPEA